MKEFQQQSHWVLGSAAILLAFGLEWFAGILLSFRHLPGLTGRERILQFFEPGQLIWAVAILLALSLLVVGRRLGPAPSRKSRVADLLPTGLLLAGASVALSALVGVLVDISDFGNGIDAAFSGLITYLAISGIGAAATWWAFKEMGRHPD
jgi:hypothetical protein